MDDRTKEIIIKTILVILGFFEAFALLIPIFSIFLLEEQTVYILKQYPPLPQPFYTIWIVDLILALLFGITFMILLPIFGLTKSKPVKAEKIAASFDNFNSLAEHIQTSAESNRYLQQPTLSFENNGLLTMYVKPTGLCEIGCIAVMYVDELTDDILDSAEDSITKALQGYYGKKQITDSVNMISIICVNRITPAFQEFVNIKLEQGLKNGRLLVGISFGGKNIYISRQKDGFAIAKYKKLRKEFLKIMQIQDP